MLVVTYPQTPEIIAGGNGCAFRWNAENQKQTNLIDGIFLCCAAVVVGKKSLIGIPHWPEHYEVLSYHFGLLIGRIGFPFCSRRSVYPPGEI